MNLLSKEEKFYQKGLEQLNKGNFSKSLHFLERALNNGYNAEDVYRLMGKINLYKLKLYEALELFNKALVYSEPGSGIDFYVGLCYYYLGNISEANEHFIRTLKSTSSHYLRCKAFEILVNKGLLDENVKQSWLSRNLDVQIDIKLDLDDNYFVSAFLERFKNNYEKSNEILFKLLEKKPSYFEIYKEIARNYYLMNNYEKAIYFYKKTQIRCFEDNTIHYYLANIFYKIDDYQKVRKELKILTRLINSNYKFYYNLGNVNYKLEKYSEAIKSYKAAIENNCNFYKSYYNLGTVYQKIGLLEDAEDSYLKAIQINPSSIRTYYNISILYLLKKNYFEALNNLLVAKSMQPNNQKVLHNFNVIKGLKYIDPKEKLESRIPFLINIFLIGLSILLLGAISYFIWG